MRPGKFTAARAWLRATICLSLALTIALPACAEPAPLPAAGTATFSDGRAPIDTLYRAYLRLVERGWKLEIVAESQPAGTDHPLPIIALRSPQGGPAVWLLAGIHGEEPAGPNAIAAAIDDIAVLGEKRPVVLMPLLNPQGYARNWRYLNVATYTKEIDGQSVGDSSHLLPDAEKPGKARAASASSAEAAAITRFVLAMSADYPPVYSFDHHEDNLIDEGYVYSQGTKGAGDPLAIEAVAVLRASGVPIKMSGKTRFDEDISGGIIGPVIDSSIDELMSSREIVLDGRMRPGPAARTVLVFETPAAALTLEKRVAAHLALIRRLTGLLATASE
jgi:hypothetical protein